MARGLVTTLGVAVLAAALLAGAVRVAALREQQYPPPPDAEDALYVTSGTAIRRMSGAYRMLAADMYWIRAIQYFGASRRQGAQTLALASDPPPLLAAIEGAEYRQLYPLLDITTTLDPRFNIAYRFGAVFLANAPPGGPGRPDLAIALLEKGLQERPDKWEYMQDAGFVDYWYRRDYRAAAVWFDKASALPGAPWWLKSLAATTLAQGGDRRSSRLMFDAIRQSADNDWLRADAERRLVQLRALDEIDALQAAVGQWSKANGPVADWLVLVRARVLRGVPLDPSGTPYDLTGDNHVQLSPRSSLWPLPEEPPTVGNRPPS